MISLLNTYLKLSIGELNHISLRELRFTCLGLGERNVLITRLSQESPGLITRISCIFGRDTGEVEKKGYFEKGNGTSLCNKECKCNKECNRLCLQHLFILLWTRILLFGGRAIFIFCSPSFFLSLSHVRD